VIFRAFSSYRAGLGEVLTQHTAQWLAPDVRHEEVRHGRAHCGLVLAGAEDRDDLDVV
jgi:hypothetical protein